MFGSSFSELVTKYSETSRTESSDSVLELEAKFGYYDTYKFVSSVRWHQFNRVKEILLNLGLSPIEEIGTDFRYEERDSAGTIRSIRERRIIKGPNNTSGTTLWQIKSNYINIDSQDYGIRLSLNNEVNISQPTGLSSNNIQSIRSRNRKSFLIDNGLSRIDLTEVTKSEPNHSDPRKRGERVIYEIEVEYVGTPDNVDKFDKTIARVFTWVNDTHNLYTINERDRLANDISSLLYGNYRELGRDLFVQARNLRQMDLVYGGLVGNNKTIYTVTYKTDGIRKLLVFHSSGIWLIYPPYEYNLVFRVDVGELNGTIFDGELLPLDKRKDGANRAIYWFWIFDTLSFYGNSQFKKGNNKKHNPSQLPHGTRIKLAKLLIESPNNNDLFKGNTLYINVKEFHSLNTVEDFYKWNSILLDKSDELPYETDGLIFTPESTVYNPRTEEKYSMKQRVLTEHPDICKWKPLKKLTIDFMIRILPDNKIQLLVGNKITFKGSDNIPYVDAVDVNNEKLIGVPTGTVVEFMWDIDRKLFVPIRLRPDKLSPNREAVAVDNWILLNDPLDEATMRGQSFTLLRRYHNSIKRSLIVGLQKLPQKTLKILDIGSGLFGDASKFASLKDKLQQIVLVEPNPSYQEELNRRIDVYGLRKKTIVVQTKGQNSNEIFNDTTILPNSFDVITLMLSLSFFWESSEILDGLVETIQRGLKIGGTILFLTIDGDIVSQVFNPIFGGTTFKELILGSVCTIQYDWTAGSNKIFIDIKDSIVRNQEEYLVRLSDLTIRLNKYGFISNEIYTADTNKFLSSAESLFTSLFSFGSFQRVGMSKIPVLIPTTSVPTGPISITQGTASKIISQSIQGQQIQGQQIQGQSIQGQSIQGLSPQLTQGQSIQLTQGPLSTDRSFLQGIPVIPVTRRPDLKAINDDTSLPLSCTWFNGRLRRIATIGDGNCFVHAVCKAFFIPYQNEESYGERVKFVTSVRADMAFALTAKSDVYPNYTYYEVSGEAGFIRLVLQEILNPSLITQLRVDFTLRGLQALFNSSANLGDEVYAYAADILGIDIFVVRGTNQDIYPHLDTSHQESKRKCVVIVGNTFHYEVVAVETINGLQTFFDYDDPFIVELKRIFRNAEPEKPPRFDPKNVINGYIYNDLANNLGVIQIPPVLNKMDPNEPIVKLIRNYPNN